MGGDDGVASAVPGELIHWSGWAQGLTATLQSKAASLNIAVRELARSQPEPSILAIGGGDYAGDDVQRFATRNSGTDDWVGQVGRAFLKAATEGLPPGIVRAGYQDFLNGVVTTTDGFVPARAPGDPILDRGPVPPH